MDERGGLVALPAAVQRPAVRGANHSPPAFRSQPRAAQQAAQYQDRRLPGRLRLLQPVLASFDGACRLEADGCRKGRRRGAQSPRRRRNALLHGRGMAQSEAARHGCHRRNGRRGEGARARDLHDAGNAGPRSVGPPQRGGARLLQPQYRYVGALLPAGDLDAHVCRSSRHAGECPAIRHESVLRRHPRHGRGRKPTASRCWSRSRISPSRRKAFRSTC